MPISDQDNDTIQRCPHDKENPYTTISKKVIRDCNISIKCRMLIVFIQSYEEITLDFLYKNFHKNISKEEIDELLDEAILAGYLGGSNE